ncbi:MAG TPA: hypothetical protein VK166_07270 [Chitinophagaceae bacterium]|nr:hypothetical protein [Chitinophagaceae bacterium]
MKKISLLVSMSFILFACQNATKEAEKPAEAAAPTETKATVEMPYKASYSSNFTQDISDKDLKTVLDSYKYWENGDFTTYASVMGDSISFTNWQGIQKMYSNADLMKTWKTFRDSLSNVRIDMIAWNKMKSDKGHQIIATYYTEYDTYKTGKVDSSDWHDLNIVDSTGKITWYNQYRKPKK